MKSNLKPRCVPLQIVDVDWYLEAYMRCATRIETEERRGAHRNLERLQRKLQALYDKIVADLEDDSAKQAQARTAAIAINHAVADYHLPRMMLRPYADRKP